MRDAERIETGRTRRVGRPCASQRTGPDEVPSRLVGLGGSVEILEPDAVRDEAIVSLGQCSRAHEDADAALAAAPMR